MKFQQRFGLAGFVCLVCVMLVIGSALNGFAQCALSLGWEPWEPYQYKAGDTVTGLDIDLVVSVLERAQCQVTLQEIPWARLLNLLEYGKINLALGASKTPEREAYAYFSQPYRSETMALFVRKGEAANYPFQAVEDLANGSFKLGIVREYYYGDRFAELLNDPAFKKQVLEADNENENYTKLLKNRIDGFLSDPFATAEGLRQAGLSEQIEMHPVPIHSNDIYVMFSQKSTTLEQVELFNQSLEALKADGTYAEIIEKYLSK